MKTFINIMAVIFIVVAFGVWGYMLFNIPENDFVFMIGWIMPMFLIVIAVGLMTSNNV